MRFNGARVLDRTADLKATYSSSISVNDDHIVCGCSDGIIRLFSAVTMQCLITLPLPNPLGSSGIDAALSSDSPPQYPHVVAIGMDMNTEFISAMYNDRSLRIWKCIAANDIQLHAHFPFHSSSIWDLVTYERETFHSSESAMHTIMTCSSDKSMRFWKIFDGKIIPCHHDSELTRTNRIPTGR